MGRRAGRYVIRDGVKRPHWPRNKELGTPLTATIISGIQKTNTDKTGPPAAVLRRAREPKVSDPKHDGNYRIISKCSALRQVIQRYLDRILRTYHQVNSAQQDFRNSPECRVLVGGCLQDVKEKKPTIAMVLLDIKRAFGEIPICCLEI